MLKAFIFPGQGSQYVGMCHDFYHEFHHAKHRLNQASDILNYDISKILFNGPENKLTLTKYAQPAIFIHSIIINDLLKMNNLKPDAVAGHSLGEITALVSAEILNFEEALSIIKVRSNAMENAGTKHPGSMAAIIGANEDQIQEICNQNTLIVPANQNAPGQTVISGENSAIDQAITLGKKMGLKRIIKLNVSGAFHSPLMQSARKPLIDIIDLVKFKTSKIPIYQNFNAKPETNITNIKKNLINQLENPVLWHQTINLMVQNKISDFHEIGPGKVLSGLNRRINKQIHTKNHGKIEDLHTYAML
ncbi:MAG: ACP S-malonyltransferase [Candidatus Neomarinimicrobiota bacterium]|nr:ACP S-malonyltransferase [Candidatus Neomarinimicrobiota bacterium]